MARRILATAAAVSCASCASCAYYSQRVYMSDAAPEAAPPSPAELAVEKLQTMKQNYNLLTKEQLAKGKQNYTYKYRFFRIYLTYISFVALFLQN